MKRSTRRAIEAVRRRRSTRARATAAVLAALLAACATPVDAPAPVLGPQQGSVRFVRDSSGLGCRRDLTIDGLPVLSINDDADRPFSWPLPPGRHVFKLGMASDQRECPEREATIEVVLVGGVEQVYRIMPMDAGKPLFVRLR